MSTKSKMLLEIDLAEHEPQFATSIESAIMLANDELLAIAETIESVDLLRPDCDKLDYALAASSGAICGLFDIFLVGKPGETAIGNISDKWFADRVKDFAKIKGWTEDCGKNPIAYLEGKYLVPYDQTGTGPTASWIKDLTPTNHHFKSLAHNPTPLGLFFSILNQWQHRSHFVTEGQLISINNVGGKLELKGETVPAKLFCGFVNWIGHLFSDMSGSAKSKGRGMGIPSPLWTWTNDVIAITQTLSIPTPKLIENMNLVALEIYKQGYDMRFQAAQGVPVIANEAITRLLYSTRRLIKHLSSAPKDGLSFSEAWAACEPFSNPTVKRMLTVAHGTFCLLDVGEATARSAAMGAGSFNVQEFCMRLNIIGLGRFAISLYGEGERALEIRTAESRARLASRERTIVDNYLAGLNKLASLYDDEELLALATSFRSSDAYILAFEASAQLADLRHVPQEKVLRSKTDIDNYFAGGDSR